MKRNNTIPQPIRAAAFRVVAVALMLVAGAAAQGLGPRPASKLKKPESSETNKVIKVNETPSGARTIGVGTNLAEIHAKAMGETSAATDPLLFRLKQLYIEAQDKARVEAQEKANKDQESRRLPPPAAPAAPAATTNSSPSNAPPGESSSD